MERFHYWTIAKVLIIVVSSIIYMTIVSVFYKKKKRASGHCLVLRHMMVKCKFWCMQMQ